jgi:hypothetical protein
MAKTSGVRTSAPNDLIDIRTFQSGRANGAGWIVRSDSCVYAAISKSLGCWSAYHDVLFHQKWAQSAPSREAEHTR